MNVLFSRFLCYSYLFYRKNKTQPVLFCFLSFLLYAIKLRFDFIVILTRVNNIHVSDNSFMEFSYLQNSVN